MFISKIHLILPMKRKNKEKTDLQYFTSHKDYNRFLPSLFESSFRTPMEKLIQDFCRLF